MEKASLLAEKSNLRIILIMKIGVITIQKSPSYGACLQSFALWKYITSKGAECEIIDLHRPTHVDFKHSDRFLPMRQETFTFKLKVLTKLLKFKDRLLGKILVSPFEKKIKQFNEKIKFSKVYRGVDDLYANPPSYDLYVTGSDQVWNPQQAYCIEPYFLTFVNNGGKKISYAASIGLKDLLPEEKAKFALWLESYDAIGVREKSAQRLIASFMNKSTVQVLDPTFLLDKESWQKEAVFPTVEKPYILLFSLFTPPNILNFAKRIAEESNKQLIVLAPNKKEVIKGGLLVNDAGPREFLGYFCQADVVITDSFHGTVFSIIMGAGNFFSYIAPNNRRGSRIVDLLKLFQVEDHLLSPELKETVFDLQSHKIDVNALTARIGRERAKSKEFLANYIHE